MVFTVASLLSGLAWSEGALIASRGLQGLGAAIVSPAALSILTTTFAEGSERNTALGAWGGVGAFGAVAGVLLGGILTDLLSWQWIFFVNAPVGVGAFLLAPVLLDESRGAEARSFDLPGAALVTGGLVALVYAITQANQYGWGSAETIGFFAAALALLVGFVAWENAHGRPAHAAVDLPAAYARRREHRRADPRHRAVRDVPDADPLHAAGARATRRCARASRTWPSRARPSSGRRWPPSSSRASA